IHEYLDRTIDKQELSSLREHMDTCIHCSRRLQSLEKTEAIVSSLRSGTVPDGLTERIMRSIPEQRKQSPWFRWMRKYPAVSVAVLFIVVMLTSVISLWNQNNTLALKGDDLEALVIT